ncbi:MAG: DUF481 domain-containing protein [Flavobacteriaceae bacterium]|nr:DUF481 domain-containing protein [Flavobacteriaceae bacterium]
MFLKCKCDKDFIKNEIPYVDYMINQKDANLELFIYGDPNGNKGLYSLYFKGNKEFKGIEKKMTFESHPKMTNDEIRVGIKDKIEKGLIRFIVETNDLENLTINFTNNNSSINDPKLDKWKNWIFEISASGYFEKESSRKESDFNARFEINRYTEDWRIESNIRYEKEKESFSNSSGNYSSSKLYKGIKGKIVRSISNHWSTGFFYNFSEDSFQNLNFSYILSPAIEYSIFPYKDVVRKEIVIEYKIGYQSNKYETKTIYGKEKEKLGIHSFAFKTRFRQNWGDIYSRLGYFSYLNFASKNRLTFDNYLNIRIFDGFSLRIGAEIRLIRDQISLSAGEASIEDLLLQQKSIATDFYNEFRLGLTYTFGSAFNNIINTRL